MRPALKQPTTPGPTPPPRYSRNISMTEHGDLNPDARVLPAHGVLAGRRSRAARRFEDSKGALSERRLVCMRRLKP